MNYKTFFKDKKIAVVGLGPHGEMVADIKFLLKAGALVSFYDLRSESRIQGYLNPLLEAGLTDYHLGKVPSDAILESQLILISPEISRKSFFLKRARQAGIPIEYPEIFFLKNAPVVTLIGVMGGSGKSTVTHMLYSILKQSFSEYEDQGLFYIDPELPHGALTHFKKIKTGDVVLARITESMMDEYHEAHISPHVAVITSLTASALQGLKKSFAVLEYQTYNNFIVASDAVMDSIRSQSHIGSKAKMLRTRAENSALVLQAAELFKVTQEVAERLMSTFTGLKSHQELIKKIEGVEFYNDAASITPEATLFALRRLSINKNTILILGGGYTDYDYRELIKTIPEYVKVLILIPGTASLGIRADLEKLDDVKFYQAPTLEEAVILAKGEARKGDKVLFSPGCEAVGVHISRRERGEKFVKAVRSL